jgi:hypothetical protein
MKEFLCNETTTFLYDFLKNEWKDNINVVHLFKTNDMFKEIQKVQLEMLEKYFHIDMAKNPNDSVIYLNKQVIFKFNNYFKDYKIIKNTTKNLKNEFLHLFFNNANKYNVNMDTLHDTICIKDYNISNLKNITLLNNTFYISRNETKQEYKIYPNLYTREVLMIYINKILSSENIKCIYDKDIEKFCFSSVNTFHIFFNNELSILLGFKNESYVGKNMYISDTLIKLNQLTNIYIQLSIAGINVDIVKTNNTLKWYTIHKKLCDTSTSIKKGTNEIKINIFNSDFVKINCDYLIDILFELSSC